MSLLLLFPSSGTGAGFCWSRQCDGSGTTTLFTRYDYDYLDTWYDWSFYTWAQVSVTHGTT